MKNFQNNIINELKKCIMKKIIFLCFCALLASCASDEDLQEINTNEKELANMINDYELVLKGYSLDELKRKKMN